MHKLQQQQRRVYLDVHFPQWKLLLGVPYRCPQSSSANEKRTLKSPSEGTEASNGALLFQRAFTQRSTLVSRSPDELSAFAPAGSGVLGRAHRQMCRSTSPLQPLHRQSRLLLHADVAFAGGPMDLHRFKL